MASGSLGWFLLGEEVGEAASSVEWGGGAKHKERSNDES